MSIQLFMAYLMIGMGIGVLTKAFGGGPEIAIAVGVAFVCVVALIKQLVFPDEKS